MYGPRHESHVPTHLGFSRRPTRRVSESDRRRGFDRQQPVFPEVSDQSRKCFLEQLCPSYVCLSGKKAGHLPRVHRTRFVNMHGDSETAFTIRRKVKATATEVLAFRSIFECLFILKTTTQIFMPRQDIS